MNGVPQNPREELVAELEGLGFDALAVITGGREWRTTLSDDELRAAIELIHEAEPDWPDIGEMVEAIQKATIALTLSERATPVHQDALAACRTILLRAEMAGRTLQ